ncbi:hypothetical protein ENBRE01_1050 [Enteropsectra breve]|nr:hypothetical protein ENBRE01_1050 [Enteropsectra breve]
MHMSSTFIYFPLYLYKQTLTNKYVSDVYPMSLFNKLESNYLIGPKVLYWFINLQYYTLHQFRASFALEKFKVSKEDYGKYTGAFGAINFFTNIVVGAISDKTRKYKLTLQFLTVFSTVVFLGFYVSPVVNFVSGSFWILLLLYLTFNNPKQPLLDKIVLEYLTKNFEGGDKFYGKQRMWGSVAYGVATYLAELCLLMGSADSSYNFDNLIYYALITTAVSIVSLMIFVRTKKTDETVAHDEKVPQEGVENNEENNEEDNEENNIEINEENINEEHIDSINKENNNGQDDKTSDNKDTPEQHRSAWQSSIELFQNKEFMFFLFIMLSNGVTRSAMSIYLTIFHRENLKLRPYDLPDSWPRWICGMIEPFNQKPITTLTIFGISFEIFVLFVADKIQSGLGLFWPLLIAQIFALFRFFAYYFLPSDSFHAYGLSCIFELIKGMYFGMAHISAVQIATKLAPSSLRATAQMLYSGVFNALGSIISGFVFGKMFKTGGDSMDDDDDAVFRRVFLYNGAICFLTILLYVYKYGVKDRVLTSRENENIKMSEMERLNEVEVK